MNHPQGQTGPSTLSYWASALHLAFLPVFVVVTRLPFEDRGGWLNIVFGLLSVTATVMTVIRVRSGLFRHRASEAGLIALSVLSSLSILAAAAAHLVTGPDSIGAGALSLLGILLHAATGLWLWIREGTRRATASPVGAARA